MAQVMVPDAVVGTARGQAQPLLGIVQFLRQLPGIALGAFPMGVSCISCERLDLNRCTAFRPGMAA